MIFASGTIQDSLITCKARQDLKFGSDHLLICTELDLRTEDTPVKKRRAWKTANLKDVSVGAIKLQASLGLPMLSTREDIDKYLNNIMAGLHALVQDTVPWAKPSKQAKSFWNAECKEATRIAREAETNYERNRTRSTWETVQSTKRQKK